MRNLASWILSKIPLSREERKLLRMFALILTTIYDWVWPNIFLRSVFILNQSFAFLLWIRIFWNFREQFEIVRCERERNQFLGNAHFIHSQGKETIRWRRKYMARAVRIDKRNAMMYWCTKSSRIQVRRTRKKCARPQILMLPLVSAAIKRRETYRHQFKCRRQTVKRDKIWPIDGAAWKRILEIDIDTLYQQICYYWTHPFRYFCFPLSSESAAGTCSCRLVVCLLDGWMNDWRCVRARRITCSLP